MYSQQHRRTIIGAFLLVLLALGYCGAAILRSSPGPGPAPAPALLMREDNPANYRAVSRVLPLLQNGDLALRTGADMTSTMLRQMNRKSKRYSHCGIVVVENGYPFVYHSIGGEDNPDERLRRDSAWAFFTPYSNERLGIARLSLSEPQKEGLCRIVHDYHRAAPLFDMAFDLATDSTLYCAEFVYKAVGKATGNPRYFPLTTAAGRTYVGVDDLYGSPRTHIIADVVFR